MCDIVIAADDATFEDKGHFDIASQVPGDGLIYAAFGTEPCPLSHVRGQILSAQEAKDLGLISEIHPRDQLLGRAWEIAEKLSKKDDLLLRYTRIVLTEPLGKWMEEMVVYHLGMEALAKLDNEDVHSDEEELGLDPGGAGVGKS